MADQVENTFSDNINWCKSLPSGEPPKKRFEAAGLENTGNFIPENDNDNKCGCCDNALDYPGCDDQSVAHRNALQHPEYAYGNQHADYVGSSEKDIESKQNIAVQKNIEDILPAQAKCLVE
jgi:hypothetical protein